ncbi:MAG: tRNA pseudouridine(55) synthase TruB [Actinomycetota bacterium]|nr:tRNA pseudouridine(55) synthase TruB [Actinomycetota bacterium]
MNRRSEARLPAVELPAGGGLLLVDKPSGCTSHDVVGWVRGLLGTRRVGHAGTLDPMATGLLVIAVNRSTKLLGHLALTDKTYLATIRLGVATSTDDAEGAPTRTADASGVSDDAIAGGLLALTGELMQVPSAVSAIKVGGRRSYERVRAGEAVELAARPVTVPRFELLGEPRRGGPVVDLDVAVDCSTGTYIRALARDLGEGLGVGGHLTALRRTKVGPFEIAGAVDVYGAAGVPERGVERAPIPDELRAAVAGSLIPAAAAARLAFRVRTATDDEALDLSYGRSLAEVGIDGSYAVLDSSGTHLLALVAEGDGKAKPRLVFDAR